MSNQKTLCYCCPGCGTKWEDQWDCEVENDCPECGMRDITPYYADICEDFDYKEQKKYLQKLFLRRLKEGRGDFVPLEFTKKAP